MRRETWVQLGAAGVMAVCLAASCALTVVISSSVGRNRLVFSDTAEEGDPPQVALGIAMGAFRGLFVNMLWMRANDLKEEGKYFESVDLAKAITKLQPRFPKVWVFHAWNLAYNISVATNTAPERWSWVKSGIELLRNEGIPNNPNDITIHKELAWIFLHKVDGRMDDAQNYYKREHAREWTIAMGPPPKLSFGKVNTEEVVKSYVNRWLRPIADAPDTMEDYYEKYPEGRELVERLKREAGFDPDVRFLQAHEELSSLNRFTSATGLAPPAAASAFVKIEAEQKYARAGAALIQHVRKRLLIDTYHMEPDRMIRYTMKYGPLDWRCAAAHAVYWSARGVEESLYRVQEQNRRDYDFLNTDRVTIQSVQQLYRTGNLTFDILNPSYMLNLPNPHFIDSYVRLIDELKSRSHVDSVAKIYSSYAAGFENFLRDAIRFLYRCGDKAKAEEYYHMLRTYPGLNANRPDYREDLTVPLEVFVVNEIVKDNRETSPDVALAEIAGALYSAYVYGLLAGDMDVFVSNFEYARLFHAKYQETQAFKVWISGPNGRMGFPPLDIFAATVLAGMIEQAGIPQGPTLYRRAPADLQGLTYAIMETSGLKVSMDEMEKQGGTPFGAMFPPPATGLEQYRARIKSATGARTGEEGNVQLK